MVEPAERQVGRSRRQVRLLAVRRQLFRQPQRSRGAVVIGFQCGATFKLDDPQVARAWTDWITAQLAAAQAPR